MKIKEILIFSILITGVVMAMNVPGLFAKALYIIISGAVFTFLLFRHDKIKLLYVGIILIIQWVASYFLLKQEDSTIVKNQPETECFALKQNDCQYSICYYPDAEIIGKRLKKLKINLLEEGNDSTIFLYLHVTIDRTRSVKEVIIDYEDGSIDENKNKYAYNFFKENVEFNVKLSNDFAGICDADLSFDMVVPYFNEE